MLGALLLSALARGWALRRAPPADDAGVARLSFHQQRTSAKTQSWATLTLDEQSNLLQGSHYDRIGPEMGYYTGFTPFLPRLGIPALKMQDGSTGFRTTEPGTVGTTTTFPCGLGLASTWDEEMVRRVAEVIGAEFKGKGANVMLGPSVAVQRVASAGRFFESLSGEDPYLGSRLTRVYVKAVQSNNVMCVIKQLGFSEQETNKRRFSAVVDPRTAWELYYPPFEAAIQAGVGGIMCAHNKVNDTYACHSPELLRRDLRIAMGFEGMVVSQWGGARGIDALEAGVDIEMPGRNKGGPGKFTLNQITTVDPRRTQDATIHVRKAIYSVGLDKIEDACSPPFCRDRLYSDQRTPERTALALEAAMASVTLLKNTNNFLPLNMDKVSKVALLGSASQIIGTGGTLQLGGNADYFSGGGSGHSNWKPGMQTMLDAMKERVKWMESVELLTIRGSNLEAILKLSSVASADVIVVVGASSSSELMDRFSLALDDQADDLIRAVAVLGKPTVVLMQTPGPVTTAWRDMPHVKAIANIFLGGEGTSRAWTGMLFGDYSPSGKLPIMFPASELDVIMPTYEITVNHTEGLYTSYRSSKLRAAYPFGHGLSFTKFSISPPKPRTSDCAGVACVQVTVTNVGKRIGAEVPQAYVEFAPELREPKLLLKGFHKVKLRPGESKDVVFSFTARDLSVYRNDMWQQQRVVRVYVGPSSGNLSDPLILRIRRGALPQKPTQPQQTTHLREPQPKEQIALRRQDQQSQRQQSTPRPKPQQVQPKPQEEQQREQPKPNQSLTQPQPQAQPKSNQSLTQPQPQAQPKSNQSLTQPQPQAQPKSNQSLTQPQPQAQPKSNQSLTQPQPQAQLNSNQSMTQPQPQAQPKSNQSLTQPQLQAQPESNQSLTQPQPQAQLNSNQSLTQPQLQAQPNSNQSLTQPQLLPNQLQTEPHHDAVAELRLQQQQALPKERPQLRPQREAEEDPELS